MSELEGAHLLDQVRAALKRYVVLPNAHAEVAVTLWIVATHAAPAVFTFPRLAIRSPEKRCGKTRLLDIIGALCRRPLPTANISSAVLYRVMGGEDPRTLIIDEADTIWGSKKQAENNEDLRGLVNAGFERGRPTLRYNAARQGVEELETFGFVALAGIGALPDTITDRSVNIVMRRRMAGEAVLPFRSKRDGAPLAELRETVHAWVADHLADVEKAEPVLPVEDRAADVWESLIIIAELAGGKWPSLAAEAAKAMTQEHDEDDGEASDSLMLLSDIRDTLTVAFMPSKDLVNALRHREESPWAEYDLSAMKLSLRLKHYKIKPKSNGSARGYFKEDFQDAFSRYLTPKASEGVKPSKGQASDGEATDTLTPQGVKASKPSGALSWENDTLTPSDTCPACSWPVDSTGHLSNCEMS